MLDDNDLVSQENLALNTKKIEDIKVSLQNMSLLINQLKILKDSGSEEEIESLATLELIPIVAGLIDQSNSLKEEVSMITDSLSEIRREIEAGDI